jgi:predicted P-loop ATPase
MQLTYSYNPRVIGKGDHHLSASGWQRNTSSVEELLQLTAGQGFGFMPALLTASGKSNDHISQFCTVCIDVDNSNGQVTTWTEAMNDPFLQANALCMWQSASSGIVNDKNPEGLDRYRILFKLPSDERICPAGNREGLKQVDVLIKRLNALIPGSDPAIKAGHYFAGRVDAAVHMFGENVLDLGQVPELPERVHTHDRQATGEFTGSADDSIRNIQRWLPFIDSASYDNWLTVCGCLRNASDVIGEDKALEMFTTWCHQDYNANDQENERMFLRMDVGQGGFGRLKELAIDGGYEQPAPVAHVETGVNELMDLLGKSQGYVVPRSGIRKSLVETPLGPTEVVWLTDLNGDKHDLTYSLGGKVMARHLTKAVEVVASESHFRYNVATRTITRDGSEVPGEELDTLHLKLSDEYGINFPSDTRKAVLSIAMRDPFDPYVDELLDIEKRVTPINISDLATRYFKATSPLADLMMEKWLVGLVGRLLDPGLPLRGVLVIVGKQGLGKDGFLQILTQGRVMNVGRDTRLKDRDFLTAANNCWVTNLAEIENVTRSQVTGELKSWITETQDTYTLKYENFARTFPRRYSLYGSCNNAKFLQDPSGNTRFWVVKSPMSKQDPVDLELLGQEREAILAGAIALYRKFQQGQYQIELNGEESDISEAHNKGYVEDAAYVSDLEELLDGRTCTCWAEILDHLGIHQAGQKANKVLTNQIHLSLDQLGWEIQGSRKLRKEGKVDISVKPIVQDLGAYDIGELVKFYESPGNKWHGDEF